MLILVAFVLLQNHIILGGYVHRLQNGGNELNPDQLETIINKMVDNESDDVELQKNAIRNLNDKFSTIKKEMPRNEFLLVNYFMTEDEMKNAVIEKLRQLRRDGKFLTKEEFKQQHKEEDSPACTTFKTLSHQEVSPDKKFCSYIKDNLQRVIAFEFLNKKFQELGVQEIFKVPEYYLVTPSLNDIKVEVITGKYAGVDILSDCILYTRGVVGDPSADKIMAEHRQIIKAIKYIDMMPDNIRKTEDGKIFILDTEAKSFEEPNLNNFQRDWSDYEKDFLHDYLKNRFYALRDKGPNSLMINFTVSLNN